MAEFTVHIACNNAAFNESHDEVSRIVRTVAYNLDSGRESGSLSDVNGNVVGSFMFVPTNSSEISQNFK